MHGHPLLPRVVLLSWAIAALVWPLVWLLLAAGQGVGVLLAGGAWIGLSAPWGAQPWGLVNEPDGGFAATRAALWSYWLTPLLSAAVLALVPLGLSTRRWRGELIVLHTAFAAAVLGLGWAPALGLEDGPAAGLARFWLVPSSLVVGAAVAAGALALQPALLRLAGHLWVMPGGPLRRRRLAIVVLHVALPATGWVGAALLLGWPLQPLAWAGLAVVVVAGLAGAFAWVPGSALRRREAPEPGAIVLAWLLAVVTALPLAWLGAADQARARGVLWGAERMTSNVRSGTVRVPLLPSARSTPRPARPAPPAPSAAGS